MSEVCMSLQCTAMFVPGSKLVKDTLGDRVDVFKFYSAAQTFEVCICGQNCIGSLLKSCCQICAIIEIVSKFLRQFEASPNAFSFQVEVLRFVVGFDEA